MAIKKMIDVKLLLKEDFNTGDWGLIPDFAPDEFNSFWQGQTIFHDVFEHWFEGEDEYFRGDAFLNVGGEMAANGFCIYLYDQMCVHNRELNASPMHSFNLSVSNNVIGMLQEIVEGEFSMYGDEIISHVPKQQKPDEFNQCEQVIQNIFEDVKGLNKKQKRKIKDLHRYGWNKAEQMFPWNYHNHNQLAEFINFWNEFCKQDAQELSQLGCNSFRFKVFKDGEFIHWSCSVSAYGMTNTFFTSKTDTPQAADIIERLFNKAYALEY